MFGITFLNSGILLALGATIFPILIYFFAKKQPQKIIFSSLRFIKQSYQKQNNKINLIDILLLIIRILIILLIILGIARPAIKLAFLKSSTEHPQTVVSIILDNSYSMNYLSGTKTNLDIGKEIVSEIGNMLNEQDKWVILTRDSKWNEWNSNVKSGEISAELIQKISISPNAISLDNLIQKAIDECKKTNIINQEIYIITDLQHEEISTESDIPIYIIPTSNEKNRKNISCQKAKFSQKLFDGNITKKVVQAELVNNSMIPIEDVIYQLYIDDLQIAEMVTSLKKGERKLVTFALDEFSAGWHKGYVIVKDERLLFDNKNYFSFQIPEKRSIGIVSQKMLPLPIQSMLDIFLNNETDEIIYLNTEEITLEQVNKLDFILFYNFDELNPQLNYILQDANNPKIFILNSSLSNREKNFVENQFSVKIKEFNNELVEISSIDKYHPITSIFDQKKLPEINNTFEIKPLQQYSSLMNTEKYPIVLTKNSDFLFAADLGRLDSQVITKSFYPILIYRLFQYIADSNFDNVSYKIDDVIFTDLPKIIDPHNNENLVQSKFRFSEIGNYYYPDNSKVFSVNLDYTESNYKKLESKYIVEKDWEQKILATRYGYELWKYLFIIVFILFMLEMIVVKIIERKGRKSVR